MKKVILISLAVVFFGQMACKDDGDNKPAPNNSTGTISDADKARLLNKTWYDHLGAFNFQFKSDGMHIMNAGLVGTWEWQNKSDTMIIANNGDNWKQIWVSIKDNEAKYRTSQGGLGFKDVFTLKTTP